MDAERACVDYLNSRNVGATAYYEVPSKRPSSFVVVERSGGPTGEGGTSRPLMDVQCWAETRRGAAVLAEGVVGALSDMTAHVDNVAHVSVSSTYRDFDLESGTPRYHVVCEMYCNE